MHTEIHVDISHFNQDTKQSSALRVKMQTTHKIFSQLSTTLTSVQLQICWIGPLLYNSCGVKWLITIDKTVN